jgi:PAS domain S-box-containing protein
MVETADMRGNSGREGSRQKDWRSGIPTVCGAITALLGVLVMAAWYAHWTALIQVLPNLPPMKFNTALGLALGGSSLSLLGKRPAIAGGFGAAAAAIGLLTALEYLARGNFGIDEFFVRPYIDTATLYAGRMSPLAASCFAFVGTGLLLAGLGRRSKTALTTAALLACSVTMIAGVALAGYMIGIDVASGWGHFSRLALHTALAFLLLGSGLLAWAREAADQIHLDFFRWLPVTASVTLMVMIAVISSVSFARLSSANYWQKHTYDVIDEAQVLLGNLTDTQRGMRGYILSGQPAALDLYQGAVADIPQQLDRLETLTSDNPGQQARLKTLRSAVADVVAYSHRLLDARDRSGIQGAVEIEATGEGLAVMNHARAELQRFADDERGLLDERTKEVHTDFDNTQRLVILGAALAGALLLLANFMASREVNFRQRAEAKLHSVAAMQTAILDSTNHAIISTGVDGRVTTFNRTAERWLGYASGEVVGKATPALWHDAEEVAARAEVLSRELGRVVEPGFKVFTAAIGRGMSEDSEWTLKRKDGTRFPARLTVTELTDPAGAVIGYLGFITDLTARKAMEGELEKNRLLLNGILNNSLDGVIAYEAVHGPAGAIEDFRFTLINPAAARFSQLTPRHIGLRLLDVFPGVAGDGLFQRLVEIVESGKTQEFEYCSHRSIPPRWYRVAGSRLGDGLSLSYTDITERRKAEEAVRLSEERFRLIVDGVRDYALFMLQPDGAIASWNAGAERLFGYTADEIVGTPFDRLFLPKAIENKHPEMELRRAERDAHYEEEGWRVRRDGSRFLAHVVLAPIHDDQGKLRGFAKITRDITAARQADKAIRDQAQILDLAHDTIFVRDADDRITYWNHGAERVYGWTKEEARGQVTHTLLKTKFPVPLREIVTRLEVQGHWEGELEHTCRDGTMITVLSRWTRQPDEEGKPPRIIEMNSDITERKRMELALGEKNIDLENAARAKNSFLANMSHELRTPLNGILGFSELLADGLPGPVNAEQKEYLVDILNSGQHLLQLINDVLDLAKVEAGKMDLHLEPFSLATAVDQVCSVAFPLVQKKNIKLVKNLDPSVDEVTLDPQKTKQVLYNLLSNAIKFTNDRGRVEINIAAKGADRFTLSVRDSGIGIRPENLKRLFKEFEQLDEGTTRRYQGTGLGLALTRKIVELQGGRISVESEFGQGTTFTVDLPMTGPEVAAS